MNINLSIDGFKKGNVYLQKIKDSLLINIDSVYVENNESIILKYEINSPEIFYINLDISKKDNRIEFFGEKGDILIKTKLKKFNSEFKISGSFNDSIYRKYLEVIKKFNYKRLDLIKISFQKSQNKEMDSVKLIETEIKDLNKRQYLYSLNYAVTNGNTHVAPFIALNEFSYGSKVLLDTIKNSLTVEVLKSKYGKMLNKTIEAK
jgi:hypothetical protein|tara:strand:+ start:1889 stop:2503 length:615 start_codon:yes stop_codon:yes gene_type:complete